MDTLFRALGEDASVRKIQELFAGEGGTSLVYGLSGSQKHAVYAAAYAAAPRPTVIIVHSQESLEDWREDLAGLLPQVTVLELPEVDAAREEFRAAASGRERSARRMDVLGRLVRGEQLIVLALAGAAVAKGMSRSDFSRLSLRLGTGEAVGLAHLIERLAGLGYERVEEVEAMGQFSARGGIVDVFPVNRTTPVRVEFFDEEIDSLREYDLGTKRSVKSIGALSILPLAQAEATGKPEPFLSYLSAEGTVIFDEPMRIREAIRTLVKENPDGKGQLFRWEDLLAAAEAHTVVFSALMLQQVHGCTPDVTMSVTVTNMTPFQRQMDLLASELSRWLAAGERVLALVSTREKADGLREMLAKRRIPSAVIEAGAELDSRLVSVQVGRLLAGFEFAQDHLVVLTERISSAA